MVGEHISKLSDWVSFQEDLEWISYSGCSHGFYIAVLSVLQHVQKLHRHMTGCWTPWRGNVVHCGLQHAAPSRFESWHMRIRELRFWGWTSLCPA
jgi:hypothetical protein